MQFKDLEGHNPCECWQFDPKTNEGQPPYVQVTTALSGPRAIVRPTPTESTPNPVILHIAPMEWLVVLPSGVMLVLNDHAAFLLLTDIM